MANFVLTIYDDPRRWITNKRNKQTDWDLLFMGCKSSEEELVKFLQLQSELNDWPELTIEEWKALVTFQKESEEETIRFEVESGLATIHDEMTDNDLPIPSSQDSCWEKYKGHLIIENFPEKTIKTIERTTHRILKRPSLQTKISEPIKGLVIGNVQSGKTANMAALMAMAADSGWNMFIILSGTIDNLREQTQDRLFGDLNQRGCHYYWRSIEHLKKNMPTGYRSQDCHFNPESREKYMTVTLKNSTRLKNLLQWMQETPAIQKQMRVLVIDDECDQAGINTASANDERKKINGLICNMVNGKTYDGKDTDGYASMNYIGYTATPYANILNEGPGESLYPKSFITTLSVSNEYFGPQQIFGIEDGDYDGLDIINNIEEADLRKIKVIHDNNALAELPDSLRDSLCWFMCGVACMRYWEYKKPISMLVHTSQKTNHHDNISRIIENWISNTPISIIKEHCRDIWASQTLHFTKDVFYHQYPNYSIPKDKVRDYPSFDELENELNKLLGGTRISKIPFDREEKVPQYHDGIHLCVDNSKNNGIADEMIVRLLYPKKEKMPSPAPAFIVVGGATLSRGLTIEGLISTYFLRSVKQSDTLMQMGRWFGYRRGYELIPRVWLTPNAVRQFEFLSSLDENLREEIRTMETLGISPEHYGPRILESPRTSFIRIVAKNRMQAAVKAEMDYRGANTQTHIFDNNEEVLSNNLTETKAFLLSLGEPVPHKSCNKHSAHTVVWRNVDSEKVIDFMYKYKFQSRQSVFNDLDNLTQWIRDVSQSGGLDNWNVVLSGKDGSHDSNDSIWTIADNISVSKIIRNNKKNATSDVLKIGALRVPKDQIADVDLDGQPESLSLSVEKFSSSKVMSIRNEAGLGTTPQLLIYIIDKDSKPKNADSKTRKNLNAVCDVIGLCINIPGGDSNRTNYVKYVTVNLDEYTAVEESDIEDEN